MGRSKSKTKDHMHIRHSEWVNFMGGKKKGEKSKKMEFEDLPYYCCPLSLQPIEDAMCNDEGVVYDIKNLLPFIKKHGKDPISGKPATLSDYFPVQFHANANGDYECPVLHKTFTKFSHIVVIKTSGHVYLYEAVKELNLNAKNMKCLLSEKPFTKTDIITIQDPEKPRSRQWAETFYVSAGVQTGADSNKGKDGPVDAASAAGASGINVDAGMGRVLKKMEEKGVASSSTLSSVPSYLTPSSSNTAKRLAATSSLSSTDRAKKLRAQAPGFTSSLITAENLKPDNPWEVVTKVDKKGYVQLQTNMGNINLEIFADKVYKASENFLGLCAKGYYNGTKFHRLIKNFMVQGGDPTASGKGGASLWDHPFKDEIFGRLKHEGAGVLSMANSGPNTNGSQFFITFKSAPHLDGKHTIFGKVVGGLNVLMSMENAEVDKKSRPVNDIVIKNVAVFVNPFDPAEIEKARLEKEEIERKKKEEEIMREDLDLRGQWFSNPTGLAILQQAGEVGKYLNKGSSNHGKVLEDSAIETMSDQRKLSTKKSKSKQFSDFSDW